MKEKKIFVTGAAGFIGRHLIRAMEGSGYLLYCLVRPEDPLPPETLPGMVWVTGDLNEPATYRSAMEECSMVVHLAAELYNPERFELINVTGVQNLISTMTACGLKRIIHLSSIGVVGASFSLERKVVHESTACTPGPGYEQSKMRSEQLLTSQIPETDLVILRPTNVYGDGHPREHLRNLINYLGSRKKIWYSSRSSVNYVYAGDVAGDIRFFIENPGLCGIFNLGSPMPVSAFFELIKKGLSSDIRIAPLPEWIFRLAYGLRGLLPLRIRLKVLSLRNAVEYSDEKLRRLHPAAYGYEQGIRNTIAFYKAGGPKHV
jgi:nucleoside-diphosphate-sugar epimerase